MFQNRARNPNFSANLISLTNSSSSSLLFQTFESNTISIGFQSNFMATLSFTSSKLPSFSISKLDTINVKTSSILSFSSPKKPSSSIRRKYSSPKATITTPSNEEKSKKGLSDERVKKVQTIEEFNKALETAKNKLVVVEFATSRSEPSAKIYPFMVQLSKTCSDVDFLLVLGDETEDARELCRRENIDKMPHFSFYKGMEKIHEEEGIGPDQLVGDVLYYGDNHSLVHQLHSKDDVESLINQHKEDGKLLVLDVGLKHCGPCVRVYPTVIKLSRSMEDTVIFARMNGDENDSCMEFLKNMDVIQVPTFLFIRDGQICGRYVGSGKGELIGEILRYQGVRVTY